MNIITKLAYNALTKTIQAIAPGGVSLKIAQTESGTYTPILTGVANVTGVTAQVTKWFKIGDMVHVSGRMNVQPTAAPTLTQLRISLPIPSNLAASEDLTGTGMPGTILSEYPFILADTATDTALYQFNTQSDVNNRQHIFQFTYPVK